MRVLIVVHGFPPHAQGGSEIHAHDHARALRRHYGDEVVVLTREQDPTRPEYGLRWEFRDGLRIAWINNTFRSIASFEETYRNTELGTIAAGIIDDFRPHVAHVHHLTCLSTTIVSSLVERGVPLVVTLHDYWLICHRGQLLDSSYRACDGPEDGGCTSCLGAAGGAGRLGFAGAAAVRAAEHYVPAARHLRRMGERALLAMAASSGSDAQRKRVDHMLAIGAQVTEFVAPSRYLRDRFIRFGIDAGRIVQSSYGVDPGPFTDVRPTSSARLRIGFIGSLMISKAPHLLLEAAMLLPEDAVSVELWGAHVSYHGDDSYRKRLEPLLSAPNVHLHGPVPHEQVPATFASIDLLVVPSIWPENSPFVIHEAFLAGVPVVASRIGGIPELIEDGHNGLLFRPNDAADLAAALQRCLSDPALLQRLRSAQTPVRTLDDEVAWTRQRYEQHLANAPTPATHGRLAAVVLNFRTPDATWLAVKSLIASDRPVDHVIVVDNGDLTGLHDWRIAGLPEGRAVEYVATGRNLGFSGGMNVGIRQALAAGADRIVLVNSDVHVPPDCLGHLEQALRGVPTAGIAAPVLRSRSTPDRITSRGIDYTLATGRMRHRGAGTFAPIDREWTASEGDRGEAAAALTTTVDAVSGCVMLVDRRVFEAIGLFDEAYFFGFEDLDLCLRATRAGFASLLVPSAVAYHGGGLSIGAESPKRLYFAARNHLRLAESAAAGGRGWHSRLRAPFIVLLNLAHALRAPGGSPIARVTAVLRGTRDYMTGRFGSGED